jgi:hypothetical protein
LSRGIFGLSVEPINRGDANTTPRLHITFLCYSCEVTGLEFKAVASNIYQDAVEITGNTYVSSNGRGNIGVWSPNSFETHVFYRLTKNIALLTKLAIICTIYRCNLGMTFN